MPRGTLWAKVYSTSPLWLTDRKTGFKNAHPEHSLSDRLAVLLVCFFGRSELFQETAQPSVKSVRDGSRLVPPLATDKCLRICLREPLVLYFDLETDTKRLANWPVVFVPLRQPVPNGLRGYYISNMVPLRDNNFDLKNRQGMRRYLLRTRRIKKHWPKHFSLENRYFYHSVQSPTELAIFHNRSTITKGKFWQTCHG